MLSVLFFLGSLIGLLFTVNGLRRRSLWLPALVTSELAIHHLAWQGVLTGAVRLGRGTRSSARPHRVRPDHPLLDRPARHGVLGGAGQAGSP